MNPNYTSKTTLQLKIILIAGIFILTIKFANAQEFKVTSDLGLWTEITLSKQILNDFTISTTQQLRLFRDFKSLDDWITDIGLEYKIDKNFAIGTNGRFNKNYHYNEPVQNDYRYNFDLKYDGKIAPKFKVYYRIRYQKEFYGNSVFNEFLNYYESTFRHRVKFVWENKSGFEIYSSAEIFRRTKKSSDAEFNKYRFWIGGEKSLKSSAIDVAFGFEHQLNNSNPYTYYLIKVKYDIEL